MYRGRRRIRKGGNVIYTSLAFHIQARQPFAHYYIEGKEKENGWFIAAAAALSLPYREKERDQIIIRREPKKHTAARGIYIGTNGLEKMLDDIRLSVFNKIFRCLIFVITEKRVNPSNFSSSINIRTTRSKNVFLLGFSDSQTRENTKASIRKTTRGQHYWLPYQNNF